MRIYVASSWRNERQPEVVYALRHDGHEVYDFRHPAPGDNGFSWAQIDPEWQSWTAEEYREALHHPLAIGGALNDIRGLTGAEALVLVLPCGRSAHLEAGWATGRGVPVFVLLDGGESAPELLYWLAGPPLLHLCLTLGELCRKLVGVAVEAGT